jgi:ammonium transporter, Amt family
MRRNVAPLGPGPGLGLGLAGLIGVAVLGAGPAVAQEAALASEAASAAITGVSLETQFILNTFLFLMSGFLVMWMAAGFAMLECGLVRKKSVGTQLLKNIGLYSIAGIMYFLIGYNLMYLDVGSYIGSIGLFYTASEVELGLLAASEEAVAAATTAVLEAGTYAVQSDWFFQMVFVATAASIVSGTLAERVRIWPFFLFVVVLTGVLYPITGAWTWGEGWLDQLGFADFAGSTIVHSVGGWAALAGALFLGARKGKYGQDGRVTPIPGSSLPLATLGTFILWLGWFGFNGGSQLAMAGAIDVIAMSSVFVNTNLAAAGGVVAAAVLHQAIYKKVDLTMVLNGAIAGLVSITAEPLTPHPMAAILIGAIGGVIVVLTVPLLDKLKIDDVVGAIPAHLFAGIWGTLAVPLTNADAGFGIQLIGILAIGAFIFAASALVWAVLKATTGIRIAEEAEAAGIDQAELGMEAYPEFGPSAAL